MKLKILGSIIIFLIHRSIARDDAFQFISFMAAHYLWWAFCNRIYGLK
jgi:hypothetical protein